MQPFPIAQALARIRKAGKLWKTPVVTQIGGDPFKVLLSCIISLRTRDEVTESASERLFALAQTPEQILALSLEHIEKFIYPSAFYRNKARSIHRICRDILDNHGGIVPDSLEDLLKLNGVGRKTANLTLTLGFGKPGICVDTHVHRICNRWGYVSTQTPDQTEMALREVLPKRYWLEINNLLVMLGQNICKPVSPMCSQCVLSGLCDRRGVLKHR